MSTTIKDLISTPVIGSKVIIGTSVNNWVSEQLYVDSLEIKDNQLQSIVDAMNYVSNQLTKWKVVKLDHRVITNSDGSYDSSWGGL